ncbi:MAG: Phage capsid protein [Anaerosporomusa subterranea]|nr:Phage capsid protein [Anaerosporomusa subterranea]
MADTVIPVALRQKAWAKETWTAAVKESFFANFMGKTSDSLIQIKEELKKESGDQITISLRMPLLGEGVEDDDVLEGNEEAMQYFDFSVQINQLRHAVRLKGKMDEKRTAKNLRAEAKDALKDWYTEKIDSKIFGALAASPSARRTIYPGAVVAASALTDADKFSTAVISKAKRAASKRTIYNTTHVLPKIRPLKVNGKKAYIMLITLEQLRDLRNDPVWVSAQENANVRGEENPILSGSEGVYDGVIIYAHESVPVTATGASGANVGHAMLLGAQAGAFAVGGEQEWNEETFDYKNKTGFEVGSIFGIAKSKFDSEDFAVIHVLTGNKAD